MSKKQRDKKGRLLPGHNVGVRFGDGQPTDRGGRKRTLLGELLHDHGFTKSEIRDTVRILAFYDRDQCEALRDDRAKPMIVQIVANQLLTALEESNYDKIRGLIEMVVGKPHQTKDVTVTDTVSDRVAVTIVKHSDIEDAEEVEEAEAEEA